MTRRSARNLPSQPTTSATRNGKEGLATSGSEEHFQRFLPEARRLPAGEVVRLRADATLAYHNVVEGVGAVWPLRERLGRELVAFPLATIATLPDLALGLIFAVNQVDRGAGTAALPGLLGAASPLREAMLVTAEALALQGLLPAREVRRIRAGRGSIDSAKDLVDLAALFRKNAGALRGKSPITVEQVRQAADLGTELLQLLRPTSRKKTPAMTPAIQQQLDDRDRLWTLLVQRHDLLWRAGAWLLGRDVTHRVPGLQGRRRRPSRALPPPAPSPAPATPHVA